MMFQDFVRQDCIVTDLTPADGKDAIMQMLDVVVAASVVDNEHTSEVLDALIRREQLGSTAIGSHRFIPHAKTPHVKQMTAAIAVCQNGFDAEAIDGLPAKFIFMLLSPPDETRKHLSCLAHLSRYTKDTILLEHLLNAESSAEIWSVLCKHDEQFASMGCL